MGIVTCGRHGCRCCWGCDRCPKCQPETGRLRKGDYCADCTEKLKARGFVWSAGHQNWVEPETKRAFEEHCRQEELFKQEHAGDYLVLSCFGDWHAKVEKGFVGVFAGLGGRTDAGHFPADTRWFLVPKDSYQPNMVIKPGDWPEIPAIQ